MATRTNHPSSPAQRRRGRPRSEPARQAILAAARDLLIGHGLGEVSMDEVALRAGVSKATIYRWWPSKHDLVLDTIYQEWAAAHPAIPDTGSLRSDLIAYLRPWLRRARERRFSRVVAELIAEAHTTPEFAERYRIQFVEARRTPVRGLFDNAIGRGEIPATDVELAMDLLFGPIYHRLLHLHAPLNDAYLARVVDAVIRSMAADPAGQRRRR